MSFKLLQRSLLWRAVRQCLRHGTTRAGTSVAVIGCLILVAPLAALAAQQVAFTGRDTGTFTFTPIPHSTLVRTDDVATGNSTFGPYTLAGSELVDLATLSVTDGSYTITFAHGDTISGTYSGQAATTHSPGVITYLVTGPITGGTGRFAGVSGELTFNGGADLNAGTLFDVITGTISKRAGH
jgi:hypothetical protein